MPDTHDGREAAVLARVDRLVDQNINIVGTEDAAFLAATVRDLREQLAEVERLRQENEQLYNYLTAEMEISREAARRLEEATLELDEAHTQLAVLGKTRGVDRPAKATRWAIRWDRSDKPLYSFPVANERYIRRRYEALLKNGVTGIALVVSRDGRPWCEVLHD